MANKRQSKVVPKGKLVEKDTININLLFSHTGTRLLTVFYTNLFTIGLFGLIGYGLDKVFGTKPLFLLVFIVVSFPLSIYMMFKKSRQLTEKIKKKNG